MKKILGVLLISVLALTVMGCGSGKKDNASKTSGTLNYSITMEPNTMLPWHGFPGMDTLPYVCEYLFRYDTSGAVQPLLVDSITGSVETLTYTLKIKKSVRFHDGSDMTAEVVAWNLNLYKSRGALTTSYYQNFINAEAADVDTVVIHLSSWDSLFPSALARTAYIVSKEAYDKNGGEAYYNEHPIGTGPFVFDTWEHNVGITLKAFNDYWGGKPVLDEIYMPIYTTVQVGQAALQTHDLDVLGLGSFPDLSVAKSLSGDSNVTVVTSPIPYTAYTLIFNSADTSTPLSDVRVRKAISYTIDIESLTQTTTYGFGKATNQWCMPGSRYYVDGLENGIYNIERAKSLLAEAGYANGFSTKLTLLQGVFEAGAQIIVESLAAIGIQVELNIVPQASYVAYISSWDGMLLHPMNMTNGAAAQYFATFMTGMEGGVGVVSLLRPDVIDRMLRSALQQVDDETATGMFKDVARLILDDYCLMKVITAVPSMLVVNNYVKDAGFATGGDVYATSMEKAWIER
jgi:peptide/nickel transport system substrate-binding protein